MGVGKGDGGKRRRGLRRNDGGGGLAVGKGRWRQAAAAYAGMTVGGGLGLENDRNDGGAAD